MGADLPRGVRRFFRLGGVRAGVADELSDHFWRVEEELVRAGWSREEAAREASRRFGDVRKWRRRMESIDRATDRRRRAGGMRDALTGSVAQAFRALWGSPGLSVAIVLAFALGIGANATVYGILDRVLFSPPPHVTAPDDVVRLLVDRAFLNRRVTSSTLSFVDIEDFEASDRFAGVAAYSNVAILTVGRGRDADRVSSRDVTADFFTLLGVRPVLGRFFTAEEDVMGGAGVVVLGHGYWMRRYSGRRDVIGETIDYGQGIYTIVGVAPRGFTGIDLSPVDLWLPVKVSAPSRLGGARWLNTRNAYFVNAVARLKPGISTAEAEADATRLHRLGREEHIAQGRYDAEARVIAAPVIAARGPNPAAEVRVARWLAGVSGIVLLIACINVANLLLGRALRRRRETAIRLALGVSRRRLVGDALMESLVLALAGGTAALAAARWGGDIMRSTLLPGVDWSAGQAGGGLIGFVIALALVSGAISALMPALQATRADVNDALRASAGAITRTTLRTRGLLSVAQAALSVVLLVGAGLFLRSLQRVGSADMGFEPDGMLVGHIVKDADGTFDDEAQRAWFERAIDQVERLPGVLGAAAATSTPFYDAYAFGMRVPGLDSIPPSPVGGPYGQAVTPDYFDVLGLAVRRGRALATGDRDGSPPVIVINHALSELLWPGEDAIGRCIHVNIERDAPLPPCAEVVGVVEVAARGSINEEATPQYYTAAAQRLIPVTPNVLFVRTGGDANRQALPVRDALLALDERLRFVEVRPLIDMAASELRPWRLGATLFTAFGLIALLVASLGLFSVLAFDVAQRVREIGLRAALGATTPGIIGLVVGRAARITAGGIAIGLTVSLLLAPRIGDLLYQVEPRDPLTFLGVAALLIGVAAVASALPAWRATKVDPNVALRTE